MQTTQATEICERYDLVVVGAGMGGLTCAALAARAGLRVLVVDKHSKLGGYAQYFKLKALAHPETVDVEPVVVHEATVDSDHHFLPGCGPGGAVDQLLRELGIRQSLDIVRLDPAYRLVMPGLALDVPGPSAELLARLAAEFPSQAGGLQTLFQDLEELGEETLASGPDQTRSPAFRLWEGTRLHEFLSARLTDARCAAVVASLWPLYGLPPRLLSTLAFAQGWHLLHGQGGAFYVRGGTFALSQALAGCVEAGGGTVLNRTRVARILLEEGHVEGVKLEDGRTIRARQVVSNADARQTYAELVGEPDAGPGVRARAESEEPSVSAMMVHLLVDAPLADGPHSTLLYATDDFEAAFQDALQPDPRFEALWITVPSRTDPQRVPPGLAMVEIMALAQWRQPHGWGADPSTYRGPDYRMLESYKALKEPLGDRMVAAAEAVLPGLTRRVLARKVATPLTMERYTFNEQGAAFGLANTPEQSGLHRPDARTPFAGLYRAGHWVAPGSGVAPVMLSGRRAAQALLEDRG